MKLTARQERFCLEYAACGNATQAYKAAGYSDKSEASMRARASKLLTNANIKTRLEEIAEEMADAKIATAREVQEVLTSILRGEEQEQVVVVEGQGGGSSEARIIVKIPNIKDRIRAAEILAKMQGAFDSTIQLEMHLPVFSGEDELSD